MTTTSLRGSATIIKFPARGRFAADHRDDAKPVSPTMPTHAVKVAGGSGWYHEEAIREAEWARKR